MGWCATGQQIKTSQTTMANIMNSSMAVVYKQGAHHGK
jgi:hypothetical protein